jgi:hypothetical protein
MPLVIMKCTIFLSDTAVITKVAGIRWLGHVIWWMRHLHLNDSCSLNPRLQTSRATKTTMVWLRDRWPGKHLCYKVEKGAKNWEKWWKLWLQPKPTRAGWALLLMIAWQFHKFTSTEDGTECAIPHSSWKIFREKCLTAVPIHFIIAYSFYILCLKTAIQNNVKVPIKTATLTGLQKPNFIGRVTLNDARNNQFFNMFRRNALQNTNIYFV